MTTVDSLEARNRLSKSVERAARGDEIVIACAWCAGSHACGLHVLRMRGARRADGRSGSARAAPGRPFAAVCSVQT